MSINEAIESTGRSLERLTALEVIYRNEELKLFESAKLATSQLNLKPEVLTLLEKLQYKMHKNSVGAFEELLTGIYRDIFPFNHSIALDIEMKRQAVNLSISLVKESGHKESIHKGNGGAVDNIVSAGLRFIALNRSRLRKFIVLDEADCWMEKERVPHFAHVIHQLAIKTGVQVLMISHNDPDNFTDKSSLIRVGNGVDADGNEHLVIKEMAGKSTPWSDDMDGIRCVRLQDYMSINDITIPLSPGVTTITGTNNSGKSAIIAGLRSLLRNEGADTDIRHNKDKASVTLDLGPEGEVMWERSRKGVKKTCYTMTHNGNEIHRNEDSKTPDWISDLGFDTDGNLNIQLGTPKSPVFLLNKPASEQAEVLRIGKESEHSTKMQDIYKVQLKKDQDTIKNSEKRLITLKHNLDVLKPLSLIRENYEHIKIELLKATAEKERLDRGDYLVQRLSVLEHQIDSANERHDVFNKEVITPEIVSTRELMAIGARLSALQKVDGIKTIDAVDVDPDYQDAIAMSSLVKRLEQLEWVSHEKSLNFTVTEPALQDSDAMVKIGTKLRNYERFQKLSNLTPLPQVAPQLQSVELSDFITRINSFVHDIEVLNAESSQAEQQFQDIKVQRDELYDALGGICPSCEQPLSFECTHDNRP